MEQKKFHPTPPKKLNYWVKMKKKNKVVPNIPKWRENWPKIIFRIFSTPPPPRWKICQKLRFFFVQIGLNCWNYILIIDNTPKKLVRKNWRTKNSNLFQIPIGQLGTNKIIKNQKNQSCSKLAEMVKNHYQYSNIAPTYNGVMWKHFQLNFCWPLFSLARLWIQTRGQLD